MKLIVGLGNPGPAYESTRHNAGFWICDIIAERIGAAFSGRKFDADIANGRIAGDAALLLKPRTFMNVSGRAVRAAAAFYRVAVDDILVLHDEVDLAPGRIRVKRGGSAAGHKGVLSIAQDLGDEGFYRLRLGVGRPDNPRVETADWVLMRLSAKERRLFDTPIERAADAAIMLFEEGLAATQNRFHAD
ncbi:aminoacyl-tRNA hydrolase [bacterium]|nr:aminoacyl-tRNA hydrolase [bacterium]